MDVKTFAAGRRERLTVGDDAIRPAVEEALQRRAEGIDEWWSGVVDAAARVWVENYQAEAPGANHAPALARFRESIGESLSKTSEPSNVDRITRWASTLATNAGTISGAGRIGVTHKMWVSMDDAKVREVHAALDGRIVPMGSTFNVAGARMPYPGVPVGPPDGWIECRCVAMPASRQGEAMTANTFAMGDDAEIEDDGIQAAGGWGAPSEIDLAVDEVPIANPDGTPYTGALIVLLPAKTDPIVAASSEPAHLTTIWMGEQADLPVDEEELEQAVRLYAQDLDGPVVVPVAERGTLGDDDADVVHLEATDSLLALRDGLLVNEPILTTYDAAEQFPEWNPHVTLGYPDRPARGEYDATEVTFDRIGLWLGGEHYDYPMGGTVSDTITADAAIDEEVVEAVDEPVETVDDDEPAFPDEIPIHGVLAPEGVETGDGRGFRNGALSTRILPVPFRTEIVGSHGGNQTSEVVDAGRIDEAWLDEASAMWRFKGAIVMSMPGAQSALESIITGVRRGVSIDADMMAHDVEAYTEEYLAEAMAAGKNPTSWFKSARVAGLTHVPIPAFEEAYVALGHDFEEDMTPEAITAAAAILEDCGCGDALTLDPIEGFANGGIVEGGRMALVGADGPEYIVPITTENRELLSQIAGGQFAPGTKDGPGWITHPQATKRIRNYWTRGEGAAKIGWGTPGDFNRCRAQLAKYVQNPDWLAGLCANMHYEVLKTWPGPKRGDKGRHALIAAGGIPAPILTLTAAAAPAVVREPYPAEWFADPQFDGVTPLRIDKASGRVFGHLAQWKSCHIGVNGACQKPPRSASGYANFIHGVIDTDAGEQPVGSLTYGIGHANPMLRASAATAHYDQTDAVWAHVNVGEDRFGIWYAGVLRDGVAEATIDDIRAIGALSGDWRRYPRFGLDLVAAVSVNTPGYSLAASGDLQPWEGHGDLQNSALGLGIVEPEIQHAGETHEEFTARIVEMAVAAVRRQDRLDALAARARNLRLADAQARIERIA